MPENMQSRRHRRDESGNSTNAQDAPAGQRNEKLDEDVACCLAEIDEVLADAESERDKALREFREIKERGGDEEEEDRQLAVWQANYAHLGLRYGRACCVAYAYDDNGIVG